MMDIGARKIDRQCFLFFSFELETPYFYVTCSLLIVRLPIKSRMHMWMQHFGA